MPQVVIKNLTREDTARLAPAIARAVSEPIGVPMDWIVVEHADTAFFRNGRPDPKSAMVWIYWKKRTRQLQETVAKALLGRSADGGGVFPGGNCLCKPGYG